MVNITGISLNSPIVYVSINEVFNLWPTFIPSNATNKEVTWNNSDNSILKVDSNGVIYVGNTAGESIVTVTSIDGAFSSSCKIVVLESVSHITGITISASAVDTNVYDITSSDSGASVYHYDKLQLNAIISPDTATDKKVFWSSSNTDIATVDENGLVYAANYGSVTIYATTEDPLCDTQEIPIVDENGDYIVDENGDKLVDAIRIPLVVPYVITCIPVPVKSISFESSYYTVAVNCAISPEIVFNPSNADDKGITWQVSDSEILSISSSGNVYGLSGGVTTIIAISHDGQHVATCTIKVIGTYAPDIENFTLDSIEEVSTGIKYTFSFNHENLFMGGYELYRSYDRSVYELAQFYADTNLQVLAGRTDSVDFISVSVDSATIEYILPTAKVKSGESIYFKIRRISINRRDRSNYTKPITTYTYPDSPDVYQDNMKLIVEYSYNKINLKFNSPITNSSNTAVKKIVVKKHLLSEKKISDLSYPYITSGDITSGDIIVIRDFKKQSLWCGIADNNDTINMNDIFLQSYSHTYTEASPPSKYNLSLYTLLDSNMVVKEITDFSKSSYIIEDDQILVNTLLVYTVDYEMPDSSIYRRIVCPLYARNIEEVHPYWRPLEASSTALLNNVGWKNMRDSLIDKNYYNKNQWDIPYSSKDNYDIVGYIGIANCYVDVYINDIFNKTVKTDDYGTYHIYYYFPIGETYVHTIARTDDNLYFSPRSQRIKINTHYIYSWFAALSMQHTQLLNQDSVLRNKISIDTSDISHIQNSYSKLTGVTLSGNEVISDFINFVKGAMTVYNNIGMEQAIVDLFSLFKSYTDNVDNILYIPNAEFEEVKIPGTNFISVQSSKIAIARNKYKYVVTACKSDGQETDGSEIDVDLRYSVQQNGCKGYNVISWDFTNYAEYYKVYRGTYNSNGSCDNTYLVTPSGVSGNKFVDIGTITPDSTYSPPSYNSSIMMNPSNLRIMNYRYINSWENLLKKPYYFTILFSMIGSNSLPAYLLSRFLFLLKNITPADMFFNVVVFNDTSIYIYDKNGNSISSITGLSNE